MVENPIWLKFDYRSSERMLSYERRLKLNEAFCVPVASFFSAEMYPPRHFRLYCLL